MSANAQIATSLPPLPAAPEPIAKRRGRPKLSEPVKSIELVDRSLSLRVQGYAIIDIARHIGVSPPTIAGWLAEAWESLPLHATASREAILARELEKLELLELRYIGAAMEGSGPALRHILEIMDRRAKYLGLYAPTKNEHLVGGEVAFGFKSQSEIERDLRAAIEKRKANREDNKSFETTVVDTRRPKT